MDLRETISLLEKQNAVIRITKEVDPKFEIAKLLNKLDEKVVLFENVKNSDYKIIGNLASTRDYFALPLGIDKSQLITTIAKAIANPKTPEIVKSGACQEIVEDEVNLNKLPILTYLPTDGGPYIASAVIIVKDPELGRNACYHRLMQIDPKSFTARIIEKRGTDTAFKKTEGDLEMAICIGNSIPVLLAAALSPEKDVDELAIANALSKTKLVKCITKDIEVPADSEIILEARMTHKVGNEGPFLDLTETIDGIRQQPIIKIDKITHRKNPIFHALLPGKNEHKLLMGMPREPTIYTEVNKVCKCNNVLITPGGCSWLHAIIQIDKQGENDGKNAITAAFQGHKSLKHCIIVDKDINIYDKNEVEWAIATRVQADKDTVILLNQDGSSLDPTGFKEPGKKTKTTKMGIDATIPLDKDKAEFTKIKYADVNIEDYVT